MSVRTAFALAGVDVSKLTDSQLEEVALDIVAEYGEDYTPSLGELRAIVERYPRAEVAEIVADYTPPVPLRDLVTYEETRPVTGSRRSAFDVRERFGINLSVYWMLLNRAIDDPEIAADYPEVVGRLRDERDRRRRLRVLR